MPHVADGILHAYLDGALDALGSAGELPDGVSAADVRAHLEQCADCRARLEEEREVRERAGMVLSAAAPAAELRPFSEIAGHSARRRRTWLPMAWAASVLLAVGAGWWGSEVWRMDRGRTAQLSAPEMLLDRDEAATAAAPTAASGAATPAAADHVAAEPARTDANAFQDQARVRDGLGSAAAPAPPPSVSSAERARAADVERQGAAGQSAQQRGDPLGAPAADAAQFRAGAELRRERAAAEEPAPAAPAAPPPPPAPEVGAFRLQENATDAQVLHFTTLLDRAAAPDARWRARTDAARTSELAIVTVHSAARADVAVRTDDRLVRVRQRLDSGHDVEIFTWTMPVVALQELVVTGAAQKAAESRAAESPPSAQRDAAARAAPATLATTFVLMQEIAAGRRELIIRVPSLDALVAIRTSAPESVLRRLGSQLVLQP